ncbi:MAG TPA: hypothetical protein VNZ52_04250 [Candidatus Thermoplasmatota archaeon]|nr:hypothetical protein [Candidatus Thermoplasmatota archaeon]
MDFLDVGLGVALGLAGAGAVGLALAASRRSRPETTLTGVWALDEVGPGAALVTERLALPTVPAGTRVLVRPGAPVPVDVLQHAEVRMHPGVRGNFCVGENDALLFLGAPAPRTLAAHTRDPALVGRARSEFQRLWTEASPYLLQLHVWDLAAHVGHDVEVGGVVLAAWEAEGHLVLTLSEEGHTVTVVSPDPRDAALKGSPVRVAGRVRESDGLPLLAAFRVERARAAPRTAGLDR